MQKESSCVVFDLETTGSNGDKNFIIEIGAVKLKHGKIVDEFHSFIACPLPLSKEVERLTGIRNKVLTVAPALKEVMTDFFNFSLKDNSILAAYNGEFNFGFLDCALTKCGIKVSYKRIDVLSMVKTRLNDKVKNYKIKTVAEYLGVESGSCTFTDEYTVAFILLKLFSLF